MKFTRFAIIALSASTGFTHADTDSVDLKLDQPQQRHHSFGVQLSSGGARYKGSSQDGDGVSQGYLYYNYALTNNWSLESGVILGTGNDSWSCTSNSDDDSFSLTCNDDEELLFEDQYEDIDYTNFVVAAKGQVFVSQRNSIYGKLGATFYDYDLSRNNKTIIDKDGAGALLEFGWQYRWDFGLGLNAGYQHVYMGDLKTNTLTAGVSYAF